MARVVIFGAGDIGRLARVYFTRDSEHEVVAFAVDAEFRQVDELLGLPVLDFDEACRRFPPNTHAMFVALSYGHMNRDRAVKYHAVKKRGYSLVSYLSSRCSFLSDEPVGDNCFILEDNTIQPFVKIGSNVTMWSGNHIGHDSVVGDHCFITSHVVVSGHVTVGAYSFIGVNATLRNSITLAPATLVGAGAIVMKDTIEKGVYLPRRAELFAKRSDEIEL
ncbi:MAG: acetyltransferase [Vicinamibacterales bacterium]